MTAFEKRIGRPIGEVDALVHVSAAARPSPMTVCQIAMREESALLAALGSAENICRHLIFPLPSK